MENSEISPDIPSESLITTHTSTADEQQTETAVTKEDLSDKLVEKPSENEFAYIDETGFTSEIFKVEIRGLPKFYGMGVMCVMPTP